MTPQKPEEFIEELDAFDPKWRERYATPLDAARAAGNVELYQLWLSAGAGKIRERLMSGVPDTVEANRLARITYDRMCLIAGWYGAVSGAGDDEELDSEE